MVWCGKVWLVRSIEEEKYGMVRYGHLGITDAPYFKLTLNFLIISRC